MFVGVNAPCHMKAPQYPQLHRTIGENQIMKKLAKKTNGKGKIRDKMSKLVADWHKVS